VKYLAKKLMIMVGKTHYFVKDSTHVIKEIRNIKVEEQNPLVNFNVVSLSTKTLVLDDAIKVIKDIIDEEFANLIKFFLKSMHFRFHGNIYEQIKGIGTRSKLLSTSLICT
jgi:hypothetical protein